jgi:16S rRNA (cytosine1402-N4)-methyltransferase
VNAFHTRLADSNQPFKEKFHPVHCSYHEIPDVLPNIEGLPSKFDVILLDLGLSSDQLADFERGFSFQADGELDLRFDQSQGSPAWEVLQRLDEKDIADILFRLGEERFSRRIAAQIVRQRKSAPVKMAKDLRELIFGCVPGSSKHGRIDPATRSFQALRIYVNDELGILSEALQSLPKLLNIGGILQVISFHSLEDRLVKNAFKEALDLESLTRKPVVADDLEVQQNPRSRSAKLRIAQKLAPENLKQPPAKEADFRRHR